MVGVAFLLEFRRVKRGTKTGVVRTIFGVGTTMDGEGLP